jgi:hypothetical protein
LGLETAVGPAERRVAGLPALRGIVAPTTVTAPTAAAASDGYESTVVDEVVEIRLGFDRQTGRLEIAGGDVRHEPRQVRSASSIVNSDAGTFDFDPTASVGSRIDLVA